MHELAIVLVPPETDDVEAAVTAILAPYSECLAPAGWGDDWRDCGTYWWDWWVIGGRWDGKIPNNVVPVRDLSEQTFYRLVLPDGRSVTRETWQESDESRYFDGYDLLPNPDFPRTMATWLIEHRDHLAVAVDYHH